MRPILRLPSTPRMLVALTAMLGVAALLGAEIAVEHLLRRDADRRASQIAGGDQRAGDRAQPQDGGARALASTDHAARHELVRSALGLGAAGLGLVLAPGLALAGLQARRRARRDQDSEDTADPLAARDPLTGLPNRQALRGQLAAALEALPRDGGALAALLIDLDQFRALNDGLGQAVGDAVLRGTAERLLGMLRREDFAARIGADEFLVVQTGLRGPVGALRLAERLSTQLARPHQIEGRSVQASATIGIALAPRDGVEVETLLRHAEAARDRAKAEARGGWRGFDPGMDAAQQARRRLAQDLRAAIDAGGLALHYQTLHRLPGREAVAREALLRWHHPERGMVSPAEFIPLAEETGLILPLGAWVLRTACRDARHWPAHQRLSVNLSPAQVRDDDILGTVRAALAESGLAPSRLELEITEGLLMQDTEVVLQRLGALRALGVRIALDDFGTGYSSLGYLWRFPFDRLKIDRSFVRVLGEEPRAGAIVETIIGLGRVLRMPVTAEGVETEDQLRALAAMDCEEVQGFLLGRPEPILREAVLAAAAE